jgi:hypothetical protein
VFLFFPHRFVFNFNRVEFKARKRFVLLNLLPGSGQVHGSIDEDRAAQQDVPTGTQFSTTAIRERKKNKKKVCCKSLRKKDELHSFDSGQKRRES